MGKPEGAETRCNRLAVTKKIEDEWQLCQGSDLSAEFAAKIKAFCHSHQLLPTQPVTELLFD